jgi:hypothetical protein
MFTMSWQWPRGGQEDNLSRGKSIRKRRIKISFTEEESNGTNNVLS